MAISTYIEVDTRRIRVQPSVSTVIKFEIYRIHALGADMFRFTRRSAPLTGVQFCESCTEVSTAGERARRHHERVILRAQTLLGPR